MSKHKNVDKEGFKTSKIHDLETLEYIKKGNLLSVRKIECCYSTTDGIYGFFPSYENKEYDDTINNQTDSFYKEFKNDYLDKIRTRAKSLNNDFIWTEIKFSTGEFIKSFTIHYDDNNHKITAIKISTNKQKISIGREGDLNKKTSTVISRNDHFIPGFKTSYIPDQNVCYLSYIQVYYENEKNLDKFFKVGKEERINFFIKKFNQLLSALKVLSKMILVLFLILFPFLFFYYKSQNLYGGEIIIPDSVIGLHNSIKIHTDSNGFCHVKAETREDSYFGLGFVHAKERLWQMDFIRRMSRGKLSEIFGKKTIEADKVMRSMGMNDLSDRQQKHVIENSKFLLYFNAYIKGINYYANNFVLPIEYKIFRADWNDWELADSLAVANYKMMSQAQDWNSEVWYNIIHESLGKEFADLVVSFKEVNHPFANETIVNDEELLQMNKHIKNNKFKKPREVLINKELETHFTESISSEEIKNKKLEVDIKEKAFKLALEELDRKESERQKSETPTDKKIENDNQLGISGVESCVTSLDLSDNEEGGINTNFPIGDMTNQGASNSWVIAGNYTLSGKPMLANDPHLTNSMPSVFFIVKIYYPDDMLVGATCPGLPYILTGANKQISWGFTSDVSDVIDLCEEKIENDFFQYDDKKYRLTTRKEVINIKGSESITIDVKSTRNGPIISKVIPKNLLAMNLPFSHVTPLSFRSSFFNFENVAVDFYFLLNHAKKSEDFIKAADKISDTNANLVYATKEGEIGWLPLGTYAVKNYTNRFCRGYTSEDDIVHIIKRDELPKLVNPHKGFIVTANNRFASQNYTYNVSSIQVPVRAYRIREMIEERMKNFTKFTIEDNINMLKDTKDSLAEHILPQILKIVERNLNGESEPVYFKELKNWNHYMDKDSTLPTVYSALELSLGKGLLNSKLDDNTARGIMSMLPYWNFISGLVDRLHKGERVDLKQCAYLSGNTNCEKYVVYVFTHLDKFISESGLKDQKGRILKWGEVKFNYYPHIPLDNPIFSKKITTGGNHNTVKIARGTFNNEKGQFASSVSSRLSFVCDMIDPSRPYLIIDGGNSGSPLSKFYDNLFEINENVELIQLDNVKFDYLDAPSGDMMILRNK